MNLCGLHFMDDPAYISLYNVDTVWKVTTKTKGATNDSYVYIKRGESRLE